MVTARYLLYTFQWRDTEYLYREWRQKYIFLRAFQKYLSKSISKDDYHYVLHANIFHIACLFFDLTCDCDTSRSEKSD